MKERPILFNGEMVRAIRDGRKSQTRRVVNPQPPTKFKFSAMKNGASIFSETTPEDFPMWANHIPCPYGQPGDRLWIRETFAPASDNWGAFARWKSDYLSRTGPSPEIFYRADGGDPFIEKWLPSIHMPRWASRITLEITGVRVERLQDISEDDVHAEGCDILTTGHEHAQEWFRGLWDSINYSRGFGWDVNPWLWVIEFRRIQK